MEGESGVASTAAPSYMPSSAGGYQRTRIGVGGIAEVEYVGSTAKPQFVLGMCENVGGVVVPAHDIQDGEWLWASLDSGSDAHTVPNQVDVHGHTVPPPCPLEDIQGGDMKVKSMRTITFEAEATSGRLVPLEGDMIVSRSKQMCLAPASWTRPDFAPCATVPTPTWSTGPAASAGRSS